MQTSIDWHMPLTHDSPSLAKSILNREEPRRREL